MPQLMFEFSGRTFGPQQAQAFQDFVSHEFYDAETILQKEQDHLYFCNRRAYAGSFPIGQHQISGSGRTIVQRSWRQIRASSTDVYLIWVPIQGSVLINQSGHHELIEEGGIAISYSNSPFSIECRPSAGKQHLSLQAIVPSHLLAKIANPKRVCGTPIAAEHGPSSIAKKIIMSLFDEAEFLSRDLATSLISAAVDAVAETLNQGEVSFAGPRSLREERVARLLDYMELHSSDPDLSVGKVAKACGISSRYVHYLLKTENKSFHASIWDKRLDLTYVLLTDKNHAKRSIAEIAYTVGFKSGAHFSRSFRKRFGRCPREVRQSSLWVGDKDRGTDSRNSGLRDRN